MKKIFKLMAVAMIAVSLPTFVACSSDDEEDDTPDNPQPQAGAYTINFNGNSWNAAGDVAAVDHTDEAYLTLYAYQDATEAANQTNPQQCMNPVVFGFLESTVCSNATYESTAGDCMTYYDANYIYTSDGTDGLEAGSYYKYNVIKSSFTENVTAIDLTALYISANWNEQVFDIVQYLANQGESYGTTMPLTGNLDNVHWTWISK